MHWRHEFLKLYLFAIKIYMKQVFPILLSPIAFIESVVFDASLTYSYGRVEDDTVPG